MTMGVFGGRGVGFGFGAGCGFGVGWGFGGAPINSLGMGIGGGCGVGLGMGWGFGFAYGARYIESRPRFQGVDFARLRDVVHPKLHTAGQGQAGEDGGRDD
ncbi:unnamed protein product [Closterium sp. NIES-54]|nr:unnamed protein product [Closterium sp. NIES-65]